MTKTIRLHVETFLQNCSIEVDEEEWEKMTPKEKECFVWQKVDKEGRFSYDFDIQDIDILE